MEEEKALDSEEEKNSVTCDKVHTSIVSLQEPKTAPLPNFPPRPSTRAAQDDKMFIHISPSSHAWKTASAVKMKTPRAVPNSENIIKCSRGGMMRVLGIIYHTSRYTSQITAYQASPRSKRP